MFKPNIIQIPQTTDNNVWHKKVRMDSDPVELVRSIIKKYHTKLTRPKNVQVYRVSKDAEIVCIVVEYFDEIRVIRTFSFPEIKHAAYLEGIVSRELAAIDREHDAWDETRYG